MTAQCRSNDSDQVRQHNAAIGRHSHKRITHRRQMDTTDTVGEHRDTHTDLLTAICQFLLQLKILYSSTTIDVLKNLSLHRLARSESQFIARDCLR